MSLVPMPMNTYDRQPASHRGSRGRVGTSTPAPASVSGRHRAEANRTGRRSALATVTVAAGLVLSPALANPAAADDSYTVRSGDTLSSIARGHDTTWRKLFSINRDVISSPTMIYPGQTLQTGGDSSAGLGSRAARGDDRPAVRGGSIDQRVLTEASQLSGIPYVYGGDSPGQGFDCSGFTSYVFGQAGKTIPRTSSAQAAAADPISRGQLRPGDLIFFSPYGDVSHVAIYAGDGMVWEAPGSGKQVQYAPIWDVPRSYGRF